MQNKAPARDDPDPYNTKRPRVYELRGWQWFLFYPAAWALRLYFLTWRFHLDEASQAALRTSRPPRLIVMWHNRSLASPEPLRRFLDTSRIACLISPSRIAAWEAAFFRLFRFRVVRGSTTRRSIQAGIELLRALRKGLDAGVTPDGPSGPLYSFQPGAVAIARKARCPLLVIVPNTRAAWRLRSWDRHLIPLPFARIDLRVHVIEPDDAVWEKSDPEAAEEIRRVCLEMTEDPFTLK